MNILAIDTATNIMGVAVTNKKELVGEMVTNLRKNHSSRLMPAIHFLLEEVEMEPEELEKIIVSKGPGSYTGVRIGLSTAKAMAWALNIPIVGVSSLEVLAYQGRNSNTLIAPFIDARRKAVFTGLYRFKQGKLINMIKDQYIKMSDWLQVLAERKEEIIFVSPDIDRFIEDIEKTLGSAAIFPEKSYQLGKPSDLIEAGKHKTPDELHTLTPKYLRLAEAEVNWLKKVKEKRNDGE